MGEGTKIEWATHTFNPWIGCTKVSPACTNCYAEVYGNRFGVEWGKSKPRRRTSEANWKKPLAWNRKATKDGKRLRVFCASLADWLDSEVPAEWLADLLALIEATPHLNWLLLTKRPELWYTRLDAARDRVRNMAGSGVWTDRWINGDAPANVWLGTTVEDQRRADERIPKLLEIPARVRFLSCEPLLGPVALPQRVALKGQVRGDWPVGHRALAEPGEHLAFSNPHGALSVETPSGRLGIKPGEFEVVGSCVNWVIAGGESGAKARPTHPDWFRSLRDQCQASGVAFHFKQHGAWAPVEGQVDPADRREIYCHEGGGASVRVGKKIAGRLLDGVEWSELPELAEMPGQHC